MNAYTLISPEELKARYVRDVSLLIVDVRTPAEYRTVHVPRSILSPVRGGTYPFLVDRDAAHPSAIYLICRTGRRALKAAPHIARHVSTEVYVVAGGLIAWEAAGLPVVRRRRTFPIEHRLRTATGGLVLLGTILGFLLHPVFSIIPVIVGAGLLIAGLVDTFSPAMSIARQHYTQDLQHPPA